MYVYLLLYLRTRRTLSNAAFTLQEAVQTDPPYMYISCRSYGPRPVKRAGQGFSDRGTLNCEIKFATFSCVKRRGTMRVKTQLPTTRQNGTRVFQDSSRTQLIDRNTYTPLIAFFHKMDTNFLLSLSPTGCTRKGAFTDLEPRLNPRSETGTLPEIKRRYLYYRPGIRRLGLLYCCRLYCRIRRPGPCGDRDA